MRVNSAAANRDGVTTASKPRAMRRFHQSAHAPSGKPDGTLGDRIASSRSWETSTARTSEADERELVGNLEVIGRQLGEHGAHGAGPGERPIAPAARELRTLQRDATTSGSVLVRIRGIRHDEDAFEAGVDVGAAEGVDGGPEPTRMTRVEVGDLQDAGPHGLCHAACSGRTVGGDEVAVRARFCAGLE